MSKRAEYRSLLNFFGYFLFSRKESNNQIIVKDKASLDIASLKDKSLAGLDNLPDPDELALEIAENLESALDSFRSIIEQLKEY